MTTQNAILNDVQKWLEGLAPDFTDKQSFLIQIERTEKEMGQVRKTLCAIAPNATSYQVIAFANEIRQAEDLLIVMRAKIEKAMPAVSEHDYARSAEWRNEALVMYEDGTKEAVKIKDEKKP